MKFLSCFNFILNQEGLYSLRILTSIFITSASFLVLKKITKTYFLFFYY